MAIANITNNILTDSGVSTSSLLPLTGGTLTGPLSGTSATFSSTTTATAFIPSGSTIPTNGMYLSAANTLNFATNSLNRFTIASNGIATFGTDLYVNRNIYVNEAESGVYADFYGRNSTSTSTPLAFLYGSAGTVTWNNGGTKMTLTSAGALQLVSSISATSATLNGNVIINSTATALSPLQVVATGTIVRLGEQSGTTGKQFLIGIDATSGRTELQSVWQGTAFTSLALQPSGGNVLIGTTGDNGAKLQVSGSATFSSSVTALSITTNSYSYLYGLRISGNDTGNTIYAGNASMGITAESGNTIFIGQSNGTTGFRVFTSSGAATFSSSVQIGTTAGYTTIVQGQFFTKGGGSMFVSNALSGGAAKHYTLQRNDATIFHIGNDGSDNLAFINASDTYVGYINKSNGIYVATSDRVLKENIADSDNALDILSKIKVRSYDWIEDGKHEPFGVIAQELYEVAPTYAYKPVGEDSNWGVAKAELVPMLIKAIQELEARVKQLENK